MINIECSECRCDLNCGDACFCEDCYKVLENTIERLDEKIHDLESTVQKYKKDKIKGV